MKTLIFSHPFLVGFLVVWTIMWVMGHFLCIYASVKTGESTSKDVREDMWFALSDIRYCFPELVELLLTWIVAPLTLGQGIREFRRLST